MTTEILWYQSYTDGEPPHCRRLLRQPRVSRWRSCIDLAVSLAGGGAWFRQVWRQAVASPPEEYWYWPDAPVPNPWDLRASGLQHKQIAAITGLSQGSVSTMTRKPRSDWWLIPAYIASRARDLYQDAVICACRAGGGQAHGEDIARVLRRWRVTGQWRRHVSGRRPPDAIRAGYLAWSQMVDGNPGLRRARKATR